MQHADVMQPPPTKSYNIGITLNNTVFT